MQVGIPGASPPPGDRTTGNSSSSAGLLPRSKALDLDESRWLDLKRGSGETFRSALERTLREAILTGALREGVRLPGSRALAHALGVSRGVVTDAYGQLEAQGFLVTRARAAPTVAAVPRRNTVRRDPEKRAPVPRYDLTPTAPDVLLFPLNRWLAAGQHAAHRANRSTLDYREPRGEQTLRAALADHLGRTRGVIADPDQIVIVQGTAQGVDLLLRILRVRGASRVAVEDPSHVTQHERTRSLGFELVPRPVDDDGMIVDGLHAEAVLVTPAHQFPTGSVLSGERRRELLAWSRQTGGLIVEDDYDSEFRYDREPVRALQGLGPGHVVQLGTISKTLAPALRLGWVVAPAALADLFASTKRLLDDFSPALDQLTFAEFLTRGHYDRHLRRARAVYRSRRDRVLAAIAEHLPELAVEGIAAGVHLLLRLPPELDDHDLASRARRAGIAVPPLSAFRLTPSETGGLVLGYGRLHESAVDGAIRALAKVVGERHS
jgi:GntR family transcriptional regulator / MocR family aminotransferase